MQQLVLLSTLMDVLVSKVNLEVLIPCCVMGALALFYSALLIIRLRQDKKE